MPHTEGECRADTNELQITPEMIEAACEVLWESGKLFAIAHGPDRLTVREMLDAALRAREPSR